MDIHSTWAAGLGLLVCTMCAIQSVLERGVLTIEGGCVLYFRAPLVDLLHVFENELLLNLVVDGTLGSVTSAHFWCYRLTCQYAGLVLDSNQHCAPG